MSRLVFSQAAGELFVVPDGTTANPAPSWVALGPAYAGRGQGLNQPSQQSVHNVGPLPRGFYGVGEPHDSATTGPFTLNLEPGAMNEMFGRSAFRIHGDNAFLNHTASDGCIVAARAIREKIVALNLTTLEVIA